MIGELNGGKAGSGYLRCKSIINSAIWDQFSQAMKIFFCPVAIKRCVTSTFADYSGEWNAIHWNNKEADFTLSI